MQELHDDYGRLGLEVITIAEDTEDDFRREVVAHRGTYLQTRDSKGDVCARWGGSGCSLGWALIGRDGRVEQMSLGSLSEESVRRLLGYAADGSDLPPFEASAAELLRIGHPLAATDAFLAGRPGTDLPEAVESSRPVLDQWRERSRQLARGVALVAWGTGESRKMTTAMYRDIGASGVVTSTENGKKITTGVVIGGYQVLAEEVPAFTTKYLRRHFAIAALIDGTDLPDDLDLRVRAAQAADESKWRLKYGDPPLQTAPDTRLGRRRVAFD